MSEPRVPLVFVSRTEHDKDHTRVQYSTSGGVILLDAEILKEYIPSSGPIDDLTLVQLFVTPHEHLALLSDLLAYAKAGKTSGPEWSSLLEKAEALLSPPTK